MEKTKTVLITNNLLPLFSENGSSVYLWSLVSSLIRCGHEVHLISYKFDILNWLKYYQTSDYSQLLESIKEAGMIPHLIPRNEFSKTSNYCKRPIQRILSPTPSDFYNGFSYSDDVNQEIAAINPDIVIAYTADAVLAVTAALKNKTFKLIGLVVDVDHLVHKYRRKYPPEKTIKTRLYKLYKSIRDTRHSEIFVNILGHCDKVICSAAHHTKWLQQKGLKEVRYFPVTVLDRAQGNYVFAGSPVQPAAASPVISLIGNVNYIATLEGLYYFKEKILTHLNAIQAETGFEIHIFGGGDLAPELADAFSKFNWIRRIGFVEDVRQTFLSSTIVLVPTSIPLGFRTRIAEAFSYGCCVVAHESNASGMPELIDGKNIMLAKTGRQFSEKINELLINKEKRLHIGTEARRTFENDYDGNAVINKLIDYCLE